jgi:eukaryotic-like serine/threonine-protein kinase
MRTFGSYHSAAVAAITLVAGGAILCGCSGIRMDRTLRPHEGDWPTFAGSSTRTGLADQTIIPPLTQMWEFDVSAGIGNGSPLMVDSTLIVGNLRGELYAADGRTGKRIGWVKLGEAIQGSPVVDGSMVYVAVSNSNESLLAFDLRTGKTEWKKDFGDVEVSPLLMKERLYFGNTEGQFFCVEPLRGDLVWKYEIPENKLHNGFRSSPAGVGTTVVIGGENGTVYALDAEKGTVRWSYKTGSYIAGTPSIADSLVFVGTLAGTMYGLELDSGRVRWRFDSGAPIYGNAAVAEGSVFFGNLAGNLIALRAGSGERLWQNTLESPINSGPAVTRGYLYIGTLKKFLFAVRTSDGSIAWKEELSGRIKTSPAAVDGQLLVATDDWTVISFKGSSQ